MKTKIRNSIIAVVCLTSFYSCRVIRPDLPSLPDVDIPAAQQPKSDIDVPITAELVNYFRQAETSVPNVYSDNQQPCQGFRYSYLLKRLPFNISGSGNKVNLSFQGEYSIDLTFCATCVFNNCIVPKISASCGVGQPLRKINIGYSTTFNILNNYQLNSSTSLITLDPVDRCTVLFLNIDVTDRLIGFVRNPLNNLGSKVDEKVNGIDFRPQVQSLWNKLSSEIKVGDFGYLSVNPQALRLSSLNLDGSILKMSIGLTSNPKINTESTQLPNNPLPDLSDYIPDNGFNIYLDLLANYDTLSRYINEQISGKTIKIGNKRFIVTKAKIYGIGNQKIVVAVDFKGRRKGTIYLTGSPFYNSISHELTFPDLAFDIKTKNLLIKIAKWIFNDKINTTLSEKVKYDFSALLNDGKQKLQTELYKDLGDNIKTTGEMNDLNIQDIYPAKSKLLLRILANGKVQVIVSQ